VKNCQGCTKKNLWSKTDKKIDGRRVWICRNCKHEQAEEPPQGLQLKPRVLYFDIETALMKTFNFSLFVPGKYINPDAIAEQSFVICWAAGWLAESGAFQYIYSDCVSQDEAVAGDDKRVLQNLWKMQDSADYVAGHNSKAFDVKIVNYRYFMNKIPAPYEFKQVDSLKMAREHFKAPSNKLDEWLKALGGEGKHEMCFDDWKQIAIDGNPERLLKMEMYCRNDVRGGIGVLNEITAWIESSGRKVYK